MGGSPPPVSQSSVQQTEFPTELKPYISDILGRGKAVYEQRAEAGYQPYLDPRIAQFDPAQQRAFAGIEGMVGGAEPYFQAAGEQLDLSGQGIGAGQQLTGAAAQTAGAGLGYLDPAAQAIASGIDVTRGGLQGILQGQQQLGQAGDITRGGLGGIQAGEAGLGRAEAVTGAGLGGIQAGQAGLGRAFGLGQYGLPSMQLGERQLGQAAGVTRGGLENFLAASGIGQQVGMDISGAEALGRRGEQGLMAGEQMLDPSARLAAASAGDIRGDIGSYMSPYMRQVMDVQKREAIRQSDIAGQADAARAAAAGAFGGSRQAILEAERERNLQQQLGDIEATGMQAAYADAARLAEAQRARELAASGQFGQIAGQAGQLGLGRGQLASTLGALAGQRAGLAGLEADIGARRGALGSQLAAIGQQQIGAGGAYGSLASQLGGLAGQQVAAGQAYGGLGSQLAGISGQRIAGGQAYGSLGSQLAGIGGQQIAGGQAYGQMGTQLGSLGSQLAGLTSQTTDVARTLGGLGQTAGQLAGQRGTLAGQYATLGTGRQGQLAQDLAALEGVGRTRQAQTQTALDQAYQQFLQEQAYPMSALQDYSSLIRGYYVNPNTTRTEMIPQPSYLQQALGAGATAVGLAGGFGAFRKEGGKVDPNGGLGSIVVKRQIGGQLVSPQLLNPTALTEEELERQAVLNQQGLGIEAAQLKKLYDNQLKTLRESNARIADLQKQKVASTQEDKDYMKLLKSRDYKKQREDLAKEYAESKEGLQYNKWLVLAKFGENLMSQGAGPLFQNLGKAGVESKAISKLMEIAQDEKDLAKQQRKELEGITDKEIETASKVSGLSREELTRQLDAQITSENAKISEVNAAVKAQKALFDAGKEAREESREMIKLRDSISTTAAKIDKAKKQGKLTENNILSSINTLFKNILTTKEGVTVFDNGTIKVDKSFYGKNAEAIQNRMSEALVQAQKVGLSGNKDAESYTKAAFLLNKLLEKGVLENPEEFNNLITPKPPKGYVKQ